MRLWKCLPSSFVSSEAPSGSPSLRATSWQGLTIFVSSSGPDVLPSWALARCYLLPTELWLSEALTVPKELPLHCCPATEHITSSRGGKAQVKARTCSVRPRCPGTGSFGSLRHHELQDDLGRSLILQPTANAVCGFCSNRASVRTGGRRPFRLRVCTMIRKLGCVLLASALRTSALAETYRLASPLPNAEKFSCMRRCTHYLAFVCMLCKGCERLHKPRYLSSILLECGCGARAQLGGPPVPRSLQRRHRQARTWCSAYRQLVGKPRQEYQNTLLQSVVRRACTHLSNFGTCMLLPNPAENFLMGGRKPSCITTYLHSSLHLC